jgi:hypothetical protein
MVSVSQNKCHVLYLIAELVMGVGGVMLWISWTLKNNKKAIQND